MSLLKFRESKSKNQIIIQEINKLKLSALANYETEFGEDNSQKYHDFLLSHLNKTQQDKYKRLIRILGQEIY